MQEYIKKYHIRAKKSLWQNFLVDEKILEKIALSGDIISRNILEVWPWYGALTEKILAQNPARLDLVELDKKMIDILEERQKEGSLWVWNIPFSICHLDVLQYQYQWDSPYSVIANIPYYITSPILFYFLYQIEKKPEIMVILMQKDVADKILSASHEKKPKSSVLSLFLYKKAYVSHICEVGRSAFEPAPKVDSSVLKFTLHSEFLEVDDEDFLSFIKKWFSEPRKKLLKNLVKNGYEKDIIEDFLQKNEYSLSLRAEDIGIHDWISLFKKIHCS